MSRSTLRRIHVGSSIAAMTVIAIFLLSTIGAETWATDDGLAAVKQWVARLIAVLVAAMIGAAMSGQRLAGRSRNALVRRKLKRMRAVGAIGLLVLIPCAVVLARLAADHDFSSLFVVLQSVELVAGAANLTLLTLNLRDGLALRSGSQRSASRSMAKEHPCNCPPTNRLATR
jgi:hypothetical protein